VQNWYSLRQQAERDHGSFKPQILPLTQGLNILLTSRGRIVFISTVANVPANLSGLGETPLALALSDDDKRLCFVFNKGTLRSRVILCCYKISDQGNCDLEKGSKVEHELKAVRKGSELSICVITMPDNYVAMIASGSGKIECIALN
jgi:hypothetical protein